MPSGGRGSCGYHPLPMAQLPADGPLTQIQREALAALVETVIRTSRREREQLAAREQAERAARVKLESTTKAVIARDEAARQRAEETCTRETARISEDGDSTVAALEREWRDTLEQIEDRALKRRTDAEKARQEAIWLAETVFEATGNQPVEQFEQTRKGLKGFTQELDSIEERASRWLRACRQPLATAPPPPENEVVLAEDRAAAVAANTLPSKHRLDQSTEEARRHVAALRQLFLPRLFRSGLPLVLLLAPATIVAALFAWRQDWIFDRTIAIAALVSLAVTAGVVAALYVIARARLQAEHRPMLDAVGAARRAMGRCEIEAAELRDRLVRELGERRDREVRHAETAHGPIVERIEENRVKKLQEAEARFPKEIAETKARRARDLVTTAAARVQGLADAERARVGELAAAEQAFRDSTAGDRERLDREWSELVAEWNRESALCYAALERVRRAIATGFRAWTDPAWDNWTPPTAFPEAIPFGSLAVDLTTLEGGLPKHADFALPGPAKFTVPAILNFPEQASLLVQTTGAGLDAAVPALQATMFRLLTALPPGKVRFTIIDPVGLGQNFAGFMHLADDDGALVSDRIWTEDRHIDQRLLDLTEHMENVIQKYLRNEYQTIGRYNVDAGEIAEPYRFLVVANLPINFSEAAARRLNSVAASGARCGVFALMTADVRAPRPPGLQIDDLARAATTLRQEPKQDAGALVLDDPVYAPWPLTLEAAPPEGLLTRVLKVVGKEAKHASRVEVPFATIAPPGPPPALARAGVADANNSVWWSRHSDKEVRVAMGRAGATKLQELMLGQGVSQHVLIAGKTGSGKSTLLHALITNLAMWYSPDEVEFYLVDFKKGVEFKTYAANELPHARAVAIESDREFGLSVLQKLDGELKRRGELYRSIGVQDLAGYRRAVQGEPNAENLPRTLLIIDEFQEFFTEDDKIGQDATLLLDRLVRQGRAFGIHVILGSQTLGGAYSLARATIGQMAVRIALQCSESDSYLILSDDNAAARLLSRPGEAIYNDAGGLIEGNNPFQIAWLGDEQRDEYLASVRLLAKQRGIRRSEPIIVFEGNVPADLPRNPLLARALAGGMSAGTTPPHAWLGDAIAIKDPTAGVFRRQSGANLLIIGQRDEAAVGMLAASTVSLLAQRPGTRICIFDGLPVDAPEAGRLSRLVDRLSTSVGDAVRSVAWRDVPEAIAEISAELERRQREDGSDAPPLFLAIAGLQRYRMLRQEDDFGFSGGADGEAPPRPDKQFGTILRDGPLFGVHTLAWVDTVNNLSRSLDRQSMKEFEQRVLFQMGQADSSQLIDSPAASRLGLHRALFFSEESGALEKFRPYAMPPDEWLDQIAAQLKARAGGVAKASE